MRNSRFPTPPRRELVRSRNDIFQRLEAVRRSRGKRKEYGECFVESVAAIDAAVGQKWEVRFIVHARDRELSGWARAVITRCPEAVVVEMAHELMAELSEREETSEILAVVATRRPDTDSIPLDTPFCALLLDRPSNPGNLGSILRSCDAFGVRGVVTRGHGADLYDPQTIRSSLGAVFTVPAVADRSNGQITAWFRTLRTTLAGLQIVGTDPGARAPLYDVDLSRPTVLVLGNERTGMSEWLRNVADLSVAIPSAGTVDSLNLASAATVLLYEVARQRAREGVGPASASARTMRQ